jgi:hypothetical protein
MIGSLTGCHKVNPTTCPTVKDGLTTGVA